MQNNKEQRSENHEQNAEYLEKLAKRRRQVAHAQKLAEKFEDLDNLRLVAAANKQASVTEDPEVLAKRLPLKHAYTQAYVGVLQEAIDLSHVSKGRASIDLFSISHDISWVGFQSEEFFQTQCERAQVEALEVFLRVLGFRETLVKAPMFTRGMAQKAGFLTVDTNRFERLSDRIENVAIEYVYGELEKPTSISIVAYPLPKT